MMNWIISFNPLKYSSHECVSWEDDLNNICDPKTTEFLFFSFSSARQHEYINPSITLSRSAVRSPGHACVRVTRSRWGKISVWLTWKKQNKTCVCIRALVCSPVGKISIDFFFFFVSDQLGLSGPFVGSIISAHYGAHTVAYQRGNESLCLSGWLHMCVCVC